MRGGRALLETEKAQWRLFCSAVQVKYGSSSSFTPSGGALRDATTALSTTDGSGTSGAKLKLKMNQVIDQGCDFEVEMLASSVLHKMRGKFASAEGDHPFDKEEVTDAQLTCLYHKIQSGKPQSLTWQRMEKRLHEL